MGQSWQPTTSHRHLSALFMKRLVPINTDGDGNASTILAGYYKFGAATLIGGGYGTSGTAIIEIADDGEDRRPNTESESG